MDSTKGGHGEEHQAFLPPTHGESHLPREKHWRRPTQYLRVVLECAMALTILGLLFRPPVCKREGRPTPVPQFPLKVYTFNPDKHYVNEDMFENNLTTAKTLHTWIPLSAKGRGYVQIPDRDRYDLGEPYTTAISRDQQGPAFMMSVFHQLHCLSYLVEHFQFGYEGVKLEKEIAHHSAHCFDYIRQALMCAADTSLEGKTESGPGWGSKHECKDYDAVLEWANEHGAMEWRNELMPGDTIL
ncbi:hypothetical protein B0T16DRAFT_432338 [Cercophora newfieldiana]|uniref:Oxidase ustYa n=1 Tax=Cercophora newfieldiana TaxID=92897 RepID=A0AA39XUY5_9PEZI|nr:hypothetical protein B0T16DRAFT_432338 [Cercophora newfieldiana]